MFANIGRIIVTAMMITVAMAGTNSAFAQKRKQPDSDIAVAKNRLLYEDAGYTSIQEAVNAAKAGQVIEILDTEVYEEQVTIDGRETSPWTGVTGGKNGITLRYVAGRDAGWNHSRPTIKWKDTQNTSPKNKVEAKTAGELVGASANFETNGALRVLRAKGVTIEGIAVDGGGAFAFGASSVWCDDDNLSCSDQFHGNAAITLSVAGGVSIRDCDLKNAYFGINIKDRNTGGVFGNPNPSDNDFTIPMSEFGKVGNHIFEYNRVNGNVVGLFFESSWDLGSTVRYNLIYNNKVNKTIVGNLPGYSNRNGGAILFKDMYLTPVAIYNNTFYDNTGNLLGEWQAGGQHLIFNNIFSKNTPDQNPGYSHMSLDGKFPNRMNNNVFSFDPSWIQSQCQSNFNCEANSAVTPGGCYVHDILNANIPKTLKTITICSGSLYKQVEMIPSGTLILSAYSASDKFTFPKGTENRWLQTEGGTYVSGSGSMKLPTLFKSITPTSPDFLVPDWENQQVIDFIKNKGWPDAGIRNSDGQIADLGAISSSGVRQFTVARITPTNVVILNGTDASASFLLRANKGAINNPKVKMLRWIAPIPANTKNTSIPGYNGYDWPNDIQVIASSAIHTITNTSSVNVGNNSLTFQTGATVIPRYGFVEIIVEGTDANNNPITSDVGFLPYRQLEYSLKIDVFPVGNTTATPLTEVKVGEPYKVRVTPYKGTAVTSPFTNGPLTEVSYSLLSDPMAFMYNVFDDMALTRDESVSVGGKTYDVYFTRAGEETIFASGVYEAGGNMRISFVGATDIVVKPRDPEGIAFLTPTSKSLLGFGAPPPAINNTGDYPVRVEVRDEFGNAVTGQSVKVTIESSAPDKCDVGVPGNISVKTADTDPATGVATFVARVTGGAVGDDFEITVTLLGGAVDVARMVIIDESVVSVRDAERVVPVVDRSQYVAVVPPVINQSKNLTAEFVAGPNPTSLKRPSGVVRFYYSGAKIKSGKLSVYDATGNLVRKLSVKDGDVSNNNIKREAASWDLTDNRGRPVSVGTYLVRGAITSQRSGKREKVSVVVGVR